MDDMSCLNAQLVRASAHVPGREMSRHVRGNGKRLSASERGGRDMRSCDLQCHYLMAGMICHMCSCDAQCQLPQWRQGLLVTCTVRSCNANYFEYDGVAATYTVVTGNANYCHVEGMTCDVHSFDLQYHFNNDGDDA